MTTWSCWKNWTTEHPYLPRPCQPASDPRGHRVGTQWIAPSVNPEGSQPPAIAGWPPSRPCCQTIRTTRRPESRHRCAAPPADREGFAWATQANAGAFFSSLPWDPSTPESPPNICAWPWWCTFQAKCLEHAPAVMICVWAPDHRNTGCMSRGDPHFRQTHELLPRAACRLPAQRVWRPSFATNWPADWGWLSANDVSCALGHGQTA